MAGPGHGRAIPDHLEGNLMMPVPRYLQHARKALHDVGLPLVGAREGASLPRRGDPFTVDANSEKSERSEQRSSFEPGHRYKTRSPFVINRTDSTFDEWRTQVGWPRAGAITIQGERLIVADVRAALQSGFIDVIHIL